MLRVDRAEPGEGIGERVQRVGFARASRQAASDRHDDMAAGDQGLLVGRRDDLAGTKRGEDRSKADDTTGRDDHEIDVVTRGELEERLVARGPIRAAREVQTGEGVGFRQRNDRRSQLPCLFRQRRPITAGRQPDDAEELRVRGDDLDRLGADRAGGAEERDAAPLR